MKTCVLLHVCMLVPLLLVVDYRPSVGAEPEQGAIVAAQPAEAMCHCFGESAPRNVSIVQALAEPLKSPGLEFREEPLENIINFLQVEYKIPIQLDMPALEDAGLTPNEPVTVNLKNISLRSALRLLLKPKNLTYVLQNEVMLITTTDVADEHLVACLYDVRDLRKAMPPPSSPAGASAWADYDSLIGALTECVHPESWAENGGGKGNIRGIHSGLLVIYQTQQVHAEIAELFDAARQTLRRPIQSLSNADGMPIEHVRDFNSGPAAMEPGGGGGGVFGRGEHSSSGFRGGYGGRGNENEPVPTPSSENPFE